MKKSLIVLSLLLILVTPIVFAFSINDFLSNLFGTNSDNTRTLEAVTYSCIKSDGSSSSYWNYNVKGTISKITVTSSSFGSSTTTQAIGSDYCLKDIGQDTTGTLLGEHYCANSYTFQIGAVDCSDYGKVCSDGKCVTSSTSPSGGGSTITPVTLSSTITTSCVGTKSKATISFSSGSAPSNGKYSIDLFKGEISNADPSTSTYYAVEVTDDTSKATETFTLNEFNIKVIGPGDVAGNVQPLSPSYALESGQKYVVWVWNGALSNKVAFTAKDCSGSGTTSAEAFTVTEDDCVNAPINGDSNIVNGVVSRIGECGSDGKTLKFCYNKKLYTETCAYGCELKSYGAFCKTKIPMYTTNTCSYLASDTGYTNSQCVTSPTQECAVVGYDVNLGSAADCTKLDKKCCANTSSTSPSGGGSTITPVTLSSTITTSCVGTKSKATISFSSGSAPSNGKYSIDLFKGEISNADPSTSTYYAVEVTDDTSKATETFTLNEFNIKVIGPGDVAGNVQPLSPSYALESGQKYVVWVWNGALSNKVAFTAKDCSGSGSKGVCTTTTCSTWTTCQVYNPSIGGQQICTDTACTNQLSLTRSCTPSCTPSCAGKCGGSDGCSGTCPNTCTAPQTCGGAGTVNVCGSSVESKTCVLGLGGVICTTGKICLNTKLISGSSDYPSSCCSSSADCVTSICTPEQTQCSGTNLQICTNNAWIFNTACLNGCVNGGCRPASCLQSETNCDDNIDNDCNNLPDCLDPACATNIMCAVCDNDIDEDGICDDEDNCIYIENEDQEDCDNDGIGDGCDTTCTSTCTLADDECMSCQTKESITGQCMEPAIDYSDYTCDGLDGQPCLENQQCTGTIGQFISVASSDSLKCCIGGICSITTPVTAQTSYEQRLGDCIDSEGDGIGTRTIYTYDTITGTQLSSTTEQCSIATRTEITEEPEYQCGDGVCHPLEDGWCDNDCPGFPWYILMILFVVVVIVGVFIYWQYYVLKRGSPISNKEQEIKLEAYVKKQLADKKSEIDIKDTLVKKGWKKNQLDYIFKKIRAQQKAKLDLASKK